MKYIKKFGTVLAGIGAGTVNGLFGTGGGMVLVPLLTSVTDLREHQIFPASVSIILPISIVSLLLSIPPQGIPWATALPYLLGSSIGGILAGLLGKKIPTSWLHRGLGLMIIWGGIRYLC